MLAVVDFELGFTYVLAGWEGPTMKPLSFEMFWKEKMDIECRKVLYHYNKIKIFDIIQLCNNLKLYSYRQILSYRYRILHTT